MMIYITRCRILLQTFGAVSGLQFLWEQSVAVYIPEGPIPLEFRPLPWKWEDSTNASPLLGLPVAAGFSVPLMESQVMGKIDARIDSLRGKHLALAARVTVANGLVLSSIWYILTLWAGDMGFFQKIQRKLEAFIWAGRPRVDRNTISQSRARGGLGVLSVADQYRAMTGNIMMWILDQGEHPLRLILQSHIQDLSKRKWGIPDLSWIVPKGGSSVSLGSPPWQNICRAWSSLKPFLRRTVPRNLEEWLDLPLWRPHSHQISETRAHCTSQAQHRLRDVGLLTIGDITEADGSFKVWESLPVQQDDQNGHRAFEALVANIRPMAHFEQQVGPHRLYFGEDSSVNDGRVWLYDVPQQSVSSRWPLIRASSLPVSTFRCKAGDIRKITRCCPPEAANLSRILVCNSRRPHGKRNHFGFWSSSRNVLLQYHWSDGSPLLDTSTSQLRALQAQQRYKPHKAALRWETELGCTIPGDIWRDMWITFRGANENTLLWQMYYRAIATQRWRFPSLPANDLQINCIRCELGIKEDIVHCVWSCPLSQPCWQWCLGLLTASSEHRHRIGGLRGLLEPAHVVVASPLPGEWKIPSRFWHILSRFFVGRFGSHAMSTSLPIADPTHIVRFVRLGTALACTL